MAIKNRAIINKAVMDIINKETNGYMIERNAPINTDMNKASQGKAWVGIYRGDMTVRAQSIGNAPWTMEGETRIVIQVFHSDGEAAEDNLEAALTDIIGVLMDPVRNPSLKLGNTVDMTNGCDIEDEFNEDVQEGHFHSATIILRWEARA